MIILLSIYLIYIVFDKIDLCKDFSLIYLILYGFFFSLSK
jgi:hypothetical protein